MKTVYNLLTFWMLYKINQMLMQNAKKQKFKELNQKKIKLKNLKEWVKMKKKKNKKLNKDMLNRWNNLRKLLKQILNLMTKNMLFVWTLLAKIE